MKKFTKKFFILLCMLGILTVNSSFYAVTKSDTNSDKDIELASTISVITDYIFENDVKGLNKVTGKSNDILDAELLSIISRNKLSGYAGNFIEFAEPDLNVEQIINNYTKIYLENMVTQVSNIEVVSTKKFKDNVDVTIKFKGLSLSEMGKPVVKLRVARFGDVSSRTLFKETNVSEDKLDSVLNYYLLSEYYTEPTRSVPRADTYSKVTFRLHYKDHRYTISVQELVKIVLAANNSV